MTGNERTEVSRFGKVPLLYVLVALAAVLPFLTGLGNGFVFDDQGLVLENPAVWSDSPITPWQSRYWPESDTAGLYRPVATFSYWLDGRLFGKSPVGFFTTNYLLHMLVSLLVLSCLRALFPTRHRLALAAASIYAVHPLHSEAVVGIAGRAELCAALGALLAYRVGLVWLRGSQNVALIPLSALALLLGLLGKESATGLLLVLGFHLVATLFGSGSSPNAEERAHAARRTVMLGVGWGVAVAVALLARIRVLGELFALGPVTQTDNVLAHVGPADRILTALYVQAYSFGQLVWPRSLSPDYSYPQIVPTGAHSVIGAAFGAVALGLLAWALVRRDLEVLWGLVFAVATAILTSNLVFPIGTVYGERLAYLPSLGVIWVLVVLIGRVLRPRPLAIALTAAVVVALGVRSAVRAPDWKTNVTLFEAATRTSSHSAKTWTNAALALIKEGRIEDGLQRAQRAIELDATYAPAVQAIGSALVQLGKPNEAIPWLEKNRNIAGKRGTEALIELGNAQLALQDGEKALGYFTEARSRSKPNDERWMVGLASAYALQSSWSESVQYWQNAVAIKPEDPAFRQRYAYVLWQHGELDQSEAIYRALWNENRTDPERANELAWFLAVTERYPEEALRLAADAYGRRPDANVADTWLEAWLQARGCEEARAWLEETEFPTTIRQPLESKLAERCGGSGNVGSSSDVGSSGVVGSSGDSSGAELEEREEEDGRER
ncbi:MAG: hypothetical protein H6682_05675 [Candidatus Eisenbacteria bacterium]|nr:hypothetical protein [Candidatus Eisenbacteria bacterium]